MTPQLIVAGVVAATCFFAGWQVNSWKHAAEREAAIVAQNEAIEAVAKELANLEIKNVTIRQELETVVREHHHYTECVHSDDGLRVLNRALTNESTGADKLPRANTADK